MPTETVDPQQHPPVEVRGTLWSYGIPSDDSLEFHRNDSSQVAALSIDPTIFGYRCKNG